MRFVDIEEVQLPDGWDERAAKALNELRTEILEAEAAALTHGDDPAAARKVAIAAGLNVPARKKIWRELSSSLSTLRKGKCWYSESLNPTSDKNVDHFRPKGSVEGEPDHEGYWWLAFCWRNYRYSSQWCNQRRVDDSTGTKGGKWDQFPLCPGSFRAQREDDDIELEVPELLDPVDPNDWKLLTFRPDGRPTPASQPCTLEYQRAITSIEVYHLHCKELVDGRRALASAIQRLIQDLETLRPKMITDLKLQKLYVRHQVALLKAIHENSEYSAAARAYARAEVYKLERDTEVKREWLQELLG